MSRDDALATSPIALPLENSFGSDNIFLYRLYQGDHAPGLFLATKLNTNDTPILKNFRMINPVMD